MSKYEVQLREFEKSMSYKVFLQAIISLNMTNPILKTSLHKPSEATNICVFDTAPRVWRDLSEDFCKFRWLM